MLARSARGVGAGRPRPLRLARRRDALAAQAHAGFGAPQTRVVAVLFADVIGFTPPERGAGAGAGLRAPRRLSRAQLQGGVSPCRHPRSSSHGFMATFGGLDGRGDGAARAVACALDLQREIDAWNAKRIARGRAGAGRGRGPLRPGGDRHDRRRPAGRVHGDRRRRQRGEPPAIRHREVGGRSSSPRELAAGAAAAGRFTRSLPLTLRGRTQPIVVACGGVGGWHRRDLGGGGVSALQDLEADAVRPSKKAIAGRLHVGDARDERDGRGRRGPHRRLDVLDAQPICSMPRCGGNAAARCLPALLVNIRIPAEIEDDPARALAALNAWSPARPAPRRRTAPPPPRPDCAGGDGRYT